MNRTIDNLPVFIVDISGYGHKPPFVVMSTNDTRRNGHGELPQVLTWNHRWVWIWAFGAHFHTVAEAQTFIDNYFLLFQEELSEIDAEEAIQ